MNRLFTKLRQRLTSEHIDDLIIATEGPSELSDDDKSLAYCWYRSKPAIDSNRIVLLIIDITHVSADSDDRPSS